MLRGLLKNRPGETIRPHAGPVPDDGSDVVAGGKSGALRAAIFGINDGLVSNLSLIMGVAGARVSNHVILLAGVAGLLPRAFFLGGREKISMRGEGGGFGRGVPPQGRRPPAPPR